MLFDAHCHLQDERLASGLEQALNRAREGGVSGWLCCAMREWDWPLVCAVSERWDEVHPAFGLHPWYTTERSTDWKDRLRELLSAFPAAWVGEIGLDHVVRPRHDADQIACFREQLEVARDYQRPVSIHCRKAWGAVLDVLDWMGPALPGVVLHSYSGGPEHVPRLVRAGAYFSFSGTLTRPRNLRGQAAARIAPDDRLLIETDAPDLLPVRPGVPPSGPDEVNEPANLVYVARYVAELRNMGLDELSEMTTRNAQRLLLGKG